MTEWDDDRDPRRREAISVAVLQFVLRELRSRGNDSTQ
jgi:hypothetical protein